MDNWRKAQIASMGRDYMAAVIANAHRVADKTEADWALVCLTAYDETHQPDVEPSDDTLDAWHDGYFAGRRNAPVTDCPHFANGWFQGRNETLHPIVVVMPTRPEGYFHMPLGTFE